MAAVSGVDIVLYNIQPDGTPGNETILDFSSSEDEPIIYYLHTVVDTLSFHVSRVAESRPCAAKLILHQDLVLLEASLPWVSIKTHAWRSRELELSFVKLPVSDLTKNQCVRYFLHPNDSFKINRLHFTLQVRQKALNQEVQVVSSRPNDVDGVVEQPDVPDVSPPSTTRLPTPDPRSGATVMETPMTDRHQAPLAAAKSYGAGRSITRSPSPTPTNLQAASNELANGNPAKTLEGNPNSQDSDTEKPLGEGYAHSGDRNGSSTIQPSPKDEIRQTRKRLASYNGKGDNHNASTPKIIDLESAPGIEKTSGDDAPRKRQKRSMRSKAILKGADESQNSIRSTIHVEVPDVVQEHLSGDEPEQKKSLTPVAESQTRPVPEGNQLPASLEPRSSGEDAGSTPRNHHSPKEPPSSNRSTRLAAQGRRGQDSSQDQIIRVYYTSSTKVEESTIYTRFLRQQNIKPVKSVTECDILCTGKGELKRTSNLILAILMGKEIVTDQWVTQSALKHKVLDTSSFIPESPAREREWGTSLSAAIERGRQGLKPLEGWTINFTPSIKKELGKSWSELKEVCLAAGAAVQAMIPRKSSAETESTVVIAASQEPDLSTLEERGWKVFTKDIITYSVLRGSIDTSSDEFLMRPAKKGNTGGKKKK
ncbi:MAG: hypothetical protein Q9196_006473 [Gyalolechia fulgens]